MKSYKIISGLALLSFAVIACNKEDLTNNENAEGQINVTITTAPELANDAIDSKTAISQDPENASLYIPSWTGNEKMGIWIDNIPTTGSDKPALLTNETAGPIATFKGNIGISAGNHTIYGFASSADNYFNKYYSDGTVRFDIPQVQHPTLESFDSDADLLIAKAQNVEIGEGQTDITIDNVQFARAVAVLKVVLTDDSEKLGSDAVITSVTLTPSDLDSNPLAGGARIDVKNGTAKYEIVSSTQKNVKAEYNDDSFVINGKNAVWLIVNPLTFSASSTLTLDAEAGKYTISKTLAVAGIELQKGDVTVFNVSLTDDDVTVQEAGLSLPLVETFDTANSGSMASGGDKWSGDDLFEVSGSVFEHSGAIRLGTSAGSITTKSALDLSQTFTVIVRGTGWSSSEKTLEIVAGDQTKQIVFADDKSSGIYEEQYATFDPETNMTKVTFRTPASGKRVLLDQIEIISGVPSSKINSVETVSAKTAETTATLNGMYNASLFNEEDVVTYGFEWGTDASNLTSVTANNAVDGEFSYELTGLTTGTTYTFRAWAQLNSEAKVYGEEMTFVPEKPVGIDPNFNITSYNEIPEGWEGNVATGSYFNLKENTYLTSPLFDMDGCTSAEVSIALGTYGGSNNQTVILNVSYDGGISYTEMHEFDVPAGPDEKPQTYSLIGPFTSTVVIKLTPNNGCTGNFGVRIQNFSLTATK